MWKDICTSVFIAALFTSQDTEAASASIDRWMDTYGF